MVQTDRGGCSHFHTCSHKSSVGAAGSRYHEMALDSWKTRVHPLVLTRDCGSPPSGIGWLGGWSLRPRPTGQSATPVRRCRSFTVHTSPGQWGGGCMALPHGHSRMNGVMGWWRDKGPYVTAVGMAEPCMLHAWAIVAHLEDGVA